jgi:hypothetical protein
MDKQTRYRELIKRCMEKWEAYVRRARHNGIEIQHIFDDANDNYLLVYVGWDRNQRVQQTTLHLRLKEDKIWIEADETEEGIATELVRAGVPRQDIVLAFHPPELRHLSDFASA